MLDRLCVVAIGCCLLPLAGCDVYEVARSDQALGRGLGVGAWLDPALEPLTGCAALEGTWSNRGSLVRADSVRPSVFAAAIGLAESFPDAAFAEEFRLAPTADGGLAITVLTGGREIAVAEIAAAGLNCADPGVALLDYQGGHGLSIDATGALWTGDHRYPRPGARVCPELGYGYWTSGSADGMATVVVGGTALLVEPSERSTLAKVREPITGVRTPATASYWLPGAQRLPARWFFKPKSQWLLTVPSATAEVSATLEECHIYALYGHSDSTEEASLALFDLGENFDWRQCSLTDLSDRGPGRIEGTELIIRKSCLGEYDPDGSERPASSLRRLQALDRVTVRREAPVDAAASAP